jgi:hypothetical protein
MIMILCMSPAPSLRMIPHTRWIAILLMADFAAERHDQPSDGAALT